MLASLSSFLCSSKYRPIVSDEDWFVLFSIWALLLICTFTFKNINHEHCYLSNLLTFIGKSMIISNFNTFLAISHLGGHNLGFGHISSEAAIFNAQIIEPYHTLAFYYKSHNRQLFNTFLRFKPLGLCHTALFKLTALGPVYLQDYSYFH